MDNWIEVLRAACTESSQQKVADRLGVSSATVNRVLKGCYGASTRAVEKRVRGELMHKMLVCPVLGEISTRRCQDEQRRPFAVTNPQRVALFRACRSGCAQRSAS